MITDLEEAQFAMERYCAYRERCEREVLDKMRQVGVEKKLYPTILSHLKSTDILNESRFVKVYVLGKFSLNRWGRYKISQALFNKGISKNLIDRGLALIEPSDYCNTLDFLIEHYRRDHGHSSSKKCLYYLKQKGYEYDLILERMKVIFK